ncbi:MAG: LysE family transporter [bacterium]|jgi:threonine/homoserine/homoserine lactone efflux protein|nr:LysE family transporter [Bacillota bacterium]HHW55781.1 LysE family transporter [Bacillota bacterium]
MGNLTLFATAFMVAFSGAMMPGPLLTVAINQSLRRGIVVGPLISLGHGLMEILVVGALLVGLGQLLEHGLVAAAVALGGGLVLAWMGYGMIREGWQGEISLDLEQGKEQRDGKGAFAAGVVATVANPYWLLWWATIGANFVALARQGGALGLVSFFSGHILADFLWYTLVAFLVFTGKGLLTDKLYRGLIVVLGFFLVGLALYFIFSVGLSGLGLLG